MKTDQFKTILAQCIVVPEIQESIDCGKRLIRSAVDVGRLPEDFVQLYSGFSPKNCDPMEEFEKHKLNPKEFLKNEFSRIPNAMCCFLSHFNIWLNLLNSDTTTAVLIFEHDAVFTSQLPNTLLEKTQYLCSFGKPSYGNFQFPEKRGIQPLRSKKYLPGAHSYLVTKAGAQRIVEEAQKNTPLPTDVFLSLTRFPFIQEFYPWLTEVQESFSTVQHEKGAKAKHAFKSNPKKYRFL